MTCEECRRRLAAEPDEPELAVRRHLAECGDCRRRHEALQLGLAALEPLPAALPDLRGGLWEAVAAATARDRAVRAAMRRERWLGLAAAALLVTLAGGYLWLRPPAWVERLPWPPTAPVLWARLDWLGLAAHGWSALPGLWDAVLAGLREAWRQLLAGLGGMDGPPLPVPPAIALAVALLLAAAAEAAARVPTTAPAGCQGGR